MGYLEGMPRILKLTTKINTLRHLVRLEMEEIEGIDIFIRKWQLALKNGINIQKFNFLKAKVSKVSKIIQAKLTIKAQSRRKPRPDGSLQSKRATTQRVPGLKGCLNLKGA